jgi:hypothetical protein
MIKKRGGKYFVLSEKTGRSFGSYTTKAAAQKRLKQVEFFKHLKSIPASKIRKPSIRKRRSA